MAKKVIDARIRQKVGTEAEWLANDLELYDGEAAIVRTGDGTPVNLKFGDGNKKFSELPYFIDFNNAQRISSVSPGALPTPAEENVYMVVTGVGAYTYGGTTIGTNADGYQTTFWFNGTTWVNNGSVRVKGDPGETPDVSGLTEKGGYDGTAKDLSDRINAGKPVIDIKSNQQFDKNSFLKGVRFTSAGVLLYDQPNAYTTFLIPVKEHTTVTVTGLTNYIHAIRFVDENDSLVSAAELTSAQTTYTASIPSGAKYVQVNFKRYTEPNDNVVNTLFIYFDSNNIRDEYIADVKIGDAFFKGVTISPEELNNRINALKPKNKVVHSNQQFNKNFFFKGVYFGNDGILKFDQPDAFTSDLMDVGSNTKINIRGLNASYLKYTRFLSSTGEILGVIESSGSGGSLGYIYDIPSGTKYAQIHFKRWTDPDPTVIDRLFVFFSTEGQYKPKDDYAESFTIDNGYVNGRQIKAKLHLDSLENTFTELTFSGDEVTQILHKEIGTNYIVRTDTFTYTTSNIKEVRTLPNGERLELTVNLSTLSTETKYYGI